MQRDCSTTVDWNVVHVALNSCWLVSNRLNENTVSGDWGQVSCKMADMDSSIDQRRKVFLLRRILAKKRKDVNTTCFAFLSWRKMEAHIWNTFSDKRFKKLLRVLGGTFLFILWAYPTWFVKRFSLRGAYSPECGLAICLYSLTRGDYLRTIAQWNGRCQCFHSMHNC